MLFKCKMCGGDIEILNSQSIATCKFCGSIMTVPTITDEHIARLHNEANRLRLANHFDAAYSVYEEIISACPKDAEAYWGSLLCQYGIEYVEDPHSEAYKPTFHKTQINTIFDDERYKNAIRYASPEARANYENEAREIERIRVLYFEISETKEPYDVFLSYKQTDAKSGKLTKDFEMAQALYNKLTAIGYRVFFSHVSLESVVGEAFEPIIFSALKTAKVLLAIGTSKENYYSEWVKNEWLRYIQIKHNENDKLLIPVFLGMSPSDLPVEFSALQAVDYGKVGAVEDLLHFIENRIPNSHGAANDQDGLISRAKQLMQEGEFGEATFQYLDNALNINPRTPVVYLHRLQWEFGLRSIENLETLEILPDDHPEWKKAVYTATLLPLETSLQQLKELSILKHKIEYACALRCALGVKQKKEVTIVELEDELRNRWQECTDEHWSSINYQRARETIQKLKVEQLKNDELVGVITCFDEIDALLERLLQRAQQENVYQIALGYMNNVGTQEAFCRAKTKLEQIIDYRDAKELIQRCQNRMESFKPQNAAEKLLKASKIKCKNKKQTVEAIKLYIDAIDFSEEDAYQGLSKCTEKLVEFEERGRGKDSPVEALIRVVCAIVGGGIGGFVVNFALAIVRIVFKSLLSGVPWWVTFGIGAVIGGIIGAIMAEDVMPAPKRSKVDGAPGMLIELWIAQLFNESIKKRNGACEDLELKKMAIGSIADCVYLLQKKIFILNFCKYDELPKYHSGLVDYAKRKGITEDIDRWDSIEKVFNVERVICDEIAKGKMLLKSTVNSVSIKHFKEILMKMAKSVVYYRYHKAVSERRYGEISYSLSRGDFLVPDDRLSDNLKRLQ